MNTENKIIKNINVDVYDRKLIHVNAKQYDKLARYILVTCYNQGVLMPINKTSQSAFVRMKKPDDNCVFNSCIVTDDGKVLVDLSEQMLSTDGNAYVDIVLVENSLIGSEITENTGELIIEDLAIFATMTFCVNIIETACNNWDIESSEEFSALNDLLNKVAQDYTQVMSACKISEINAKNSEDNAKISEDNAKISENNAATSEDNAKRSETNAKKSENNASVSEANAKTSEVNAKNSETNAKESEIKAKESEGVAITKAEESLNSAIESANSATIAVSKAEETIGYATLSQSYAVGGTNTRENEDLDNSKYYYSQTKAIQDNLKESVDMILNEMHLTVIDDDNGNVEFIYSSKIDGNTLIEMEKMIENLQSRMEALEEQNVLEIVE